MYRMLRPRSSTFGAILSLALLAWMTLALDAFAAPLPAMSHGKQGPSHIDTALGTAMSGMSADCAGMSRSATRPPRTASANPSQSGQGAGCPCCNGTGCTCASLCGGMSTIAYIAVWFDPTQAIVPVLDSRATPAAHASPALRPPIV